MNFECGNIDISKPYQYANEKSQAIGKANIINSFSADSQNPSYKVVIWKVNASLFIEQDFALKSKFKGSQGRPVLFPACRESYYPNTQICLHINVLFNNFYAFFILLSNMACGYLKVKTNTYTDHCAQQTSHFLSLLYYCRTNF